jgi:membrane associated rhomboid family serine protease
MVFPISDDNRGRRRTPYVTFGLIAANVLVFVFLQNLGDNLKFTFEYSVVPKKILTGKDFSTPDRVVQDPQTGEAVRMPGIPATPINVYFTLLTSMFLHGGMMHILGNMWFLWIFGDNVEDDMGPDRYLVFYLVCGILASLAHVLTNRTGEASMLPSLGASGAISGVLAGYVLIHPKRRVRVILFRFLTDVPAFVAIGIWFAFQLFSGVFGAGDEGVAYAAHVGGFAAGLILIKPFLIGREPVPDTDPYRLGPN